MRAACVWGVPRPHLRGDHAVGTGIISTCVMLLAPKSIVSAASSDGPRRRRSRWPPTGPGVIPTPTGSGFPTMDPAPSASSPAGLSTARGPFPRASGAVLVGSFPQVSVPDPRAATPTSLGQTVAHSGMPWAPTPSPSVSSRPPDSVGPPPRCVPLSPGAGEGPRRSSRPRAPPPYLGDYAWSLHHMGVPPEEAPPVVWVPLPRSTVEYPGALWIPTTFPEHFPRAPDGQWWFLVARNRCQRATPP